MIQATNELILGIQLNEAFAQLTYYHQSVREPVTLGWNADPEQLLIPMGLRRDAKGQWNIWDGKPQLPGEEPDQVRISGLYAKLEEALGAGGDSKEDVGNAPAGEGGGKAAGGSAEGGENSGSKAVGSAAAGTVVCDGETFGAAELLAAYFEVCLAQLKLLTHNTKVHVMVTVRTLTEGWSALIAEALGRCGVERRQIYLQDYLSSFYYYTVNQKKELWYQDVALLEYEDEAIVGYVLHIDRSTRPALARVDRVAAQPMSDAVRAGRSDADWKREKDRLFFELLKKVFERRTISVSYLMGDYFNKSWAERSIQYLCYKRHAFQGQNLYSRGACYAAMERAGLIAGREIIFSGCDMIERNIGMEMRIRGKETYYPLVSAGVNWYEVHHVCEFILNHEREIRIISQPMTPGGESIVHSMRLTGLPPRPPRATRIRLTVWFTSPAQCHMEAEDLGFGGFYRPSGLSWSREIYF